MSAERRAQHIRQPGQQPPGQGRGRPSGDRRARQVKIVIAGTAIAIAGLSIARVTGLIGPSDTPQDPPPERVENHDDQTRRQAETEDQFMPPGSP